MKRRWAVRLPKPLQEMTDEDIAEFSRQVCDALRPMMDDVDQEAQTQEAPRDADQGHPPVGR